MPRLAAGPAPGTRTEQQMAGQQTPDAVAPVEDRDNLTYLADALGSAMAGRQADRAVVEAASGDNPRARELLLQVVAEAMARHAKTPDALTPLPKEIARLHNAASQLGQGQAEAARRLEGLSEGQARQQELLTQELAGLKSMLHGLSIRLNDGLADELETIDERIVRLAAATQGRERQQKRVFALALTACTILALLAGLAVGAVIVAGSPEAAFDSLRGAVSGVAGGR